MNATRKRPIFDCCQICGGALNRCGVNAVYCMKCSSFAEKVKAKAFASVVKAVLRGELAPALTLKCVDCGADAKYYDHRDYSKPLEVVPVCHSCNVLRGPALYTKVAA